VTVDRQLLDATLDELNVALRSHGGAVEAVPSDDGALHLRMLGLCAGCLYRPLTTVTTIRPFIAERLGVDVVVEGARISAQAEQRLAAAFGSSYPALPMVGSTHRCG
jgi:Fe-S cluster biogenesis protein NfuA